MLHNQGPSAPAPRASSECGVGIGRAMVTFSADIGSSCFRFANSSACARTDFLRRIFLHRQTARWARPDRAAPFGTSLAAAHAGLCRLTGRESDDAGGLGASLVDQRRGLLLGGNTASPAADRAPAQFNNLFPAREGRFYLVGGAGQSAICSPRPVRFTMVAARISSGTTPE